MDNYRYYRLKRRKCLAITALVAIIIAASDDTQAQIYNCNGTWTTQACPGSTPAITEVEKTAKPLDASQKIKKELVHAATTARYQAKERSGVDLDSSGIEKFCEAKESSLKDCQERVEQYLGRLDTRVIEQERLNLQKREVELNEKKLQHDHQDSPNVVVIQSYPPTPTHWHWPPYPTHSLPAQPPAWGTRPQHVPAPSRGEVPNDARVPR